MSLTADGPWLRLSLSLSLSLSLCMWMCVCVWWGGVCVQCEGNNKAYALTSDKVKGRADGCCCLRALPRYAVLQTWNWSFGSLVPDRLLTGQQRQQSPVPLVHSTRLHVYYLHCATGYFPSSIWGTARQAATAISGTLPPIDMPWQSTLFLRQPVGNGRRAVSIESPDMPHAPCKRIKLITSRVQLAALIRTQRECPV